MLGKRFGTLTVLAEQGVYRGDTKWLCICDCGNFTVVRGHYLRSGHTQTCGKGCLTFSKCADGVVCTVKSGKTFLIDEDDLDFVKQYRWSVDKDGYVRGGKGKERNLKLHRVLLNVQKGQVVDHINGNPSDCRKNNLRITTQHNNTFNAKLPKSSTTGYKGVCFDKSRNKYMAHIHPNGRMIFLGYFDDVIEAAHAYDEAASLYFGEYARFNFVRKEVG